MWKATLGKSVRSDDEAGDDYSRACAVGGYVGTIEGAGGQILVIGDLPNDLMVYRNTESEAILVKWVGADSDAQILEALDSDRDLPFVPGNIRLELTVPELTIFDASCLLDEVGSNRLNLTLSPTIYTADVLNYEPNDRLMLQLIRLRPAN